jgi:raffinose/stachyose/melibiose transport system substrate-binding protein
VPLALLGAAYATSVFVAFRHASAGGSTDRVTIRFCHWQLETGVRDAVAGMIRRYEQINPRVHVIQIAIPGGPAGSTYGTWVLTQMAAGNGPDLVQYDALHPDVARLFQPINAEVEKPNPYDRGTPLEGLRWRDTFVDGMITNFDRNLLGYYSASLDVHMQRITYNRRLMKTITGSDAPPRTYRELLALCAAIRAYARTHGLNLEPMANPPDANKGQCWYITMAMSDRLCERIDFQHKLVLGPDDLGQSYLRRDWSYDSPEAVAAFQEIKEFGEMCGPGFWARSRDAAVTDFVCGRAVMFVAPSWQATTLLGICDFPVAVFTYPYPREDDPVYGRYVKGPFSDGQLIPGMEIFLNRATPHRAEAVDFLRFMTSQEGGTIFSNLSNWQSATVGVKPSAFAAQYKFQTEGYCWNGNLFVPSIKNDAPNFIVTHLPELWSPDGGVDAFRQSMRDGLGDRIRDDFGEEVISDLDNLRRQDVEAAMQESEDGPDRRPDVLPLLETVNEGILYQTRALAEPPVPVRLGLAQLPLDETPGPGPDPVRLPADEAARQAEFRRGLAVLGQQSISEDKLDQACRIFSGLADGGGDDAGLGARFFLGRVAQHHRQVPDPAEAARQYGRLIAEHPHSFWAQTALAPLALLEIYALDTSSPPELRLARADKLLAFADTASARSNVHLAIAYAVFYYRLPAAEALPHLLAAEPLRRIDALLRADVLVQIAELSRLAGDKPQAARYYQTFLDENPNDLRRYLIRQRLAALL